MRFAVLVTGIAMMFPGAVQCRGGGGARWANPRTRHGDVPLARDGTIGEPDAP